MKLLLIAFSKTMKRADWLTNTTVLALISRDTATVIIIHSICATSPIFAWPFSTFVDILSGI